MCLLFAGLLAGAGRELPLAAADAATWRQLAVPGSASEMALLGQMGGTANALWVAGHHAFVGIGPRMVVADVADPRAPVEVARSELLGGMVSGIHVSADQAYVAAGTGGLQVLNVRDPAHPLRVASLPTAGSAAAVYVEGGQAFVSEGDAGIEIVDVSDAPRPVLLGALTDMPARAVFVHDGRAYIAAGEEGLYIADVGDPTAPVVLGRLDTAGSAVGTHVVGRTVYVADGDGGFLIVDASNPAQPVVVDRDPDIWPAFSLWVAGARAYVAAAGLHVLDVSDPRRTHEVGVAVPRVAGGDGRPAVLTHVAVLGDHAFVTDPALGLRVIDVRDSEGVHEVAVIEDVGGPWDMEVDGHYLYYAAEWVLRVFDVSEPTRPVEVGHLDADVQFGPMVVAGGYVYLSTFQAGLWVIDAHDVRDPRVVGKLDGLSANTDLHYDGGHVFWFDGQGARIIDVREPTAPRIVGEFLLPRGVSRLVGGDGLVYAVCDGGCYIDVGSSGGQGVQIVAYDVRQAASPRIVGHLDTGRSFWLWDTVIDDAHLYVQTNEGLRIFDVSGPEAMRELGSIALPSSGPMMGDQSYGGVAVADGHAYVLGTYMYVVDVSNPWSPTLVGAHPRVGFLPPRIANGHVFVCGEHGEMVSVFILDARDPRGPVEVGALDPANRMSAVLGMGARALVGDGHEGLRIVSALDPAAPRVEGSYQPGQGAIHDIFVSGRRAYVVVRGREVDALSILSLDDPAVPRELGVEGFWGRLTGVAVRDTVAYLSSNWGMDTYDVSAPERPRWLARYESPGYGRALTVHGGRAYLADGPAGLRIVMVSDPAQPYGAGVHGVGAGDQVMDVSVVDRHAFIVVAGAPRLEVVDVADASVPRLVGRVGLSGMPSSLWVDGALAYVASGAAGLHVVDLTDPAAPRVVGTWLDGGDFNVNSVSGAPERVYVATETAGLFVYGPPGSVRVYRVHLPQVLGGR